MISQYRYLLKKPRRKIKNYFSSAAATPGVIFPLLEQRTEYYLRKLEEPKEKMFRKKIGQLHDVLGEEYPKVLSLQEQGTFYLGYYHQITKEEKK